MTKTVPVPDHDPLRTGTPRREAKVWGKAGSAAKSLASPGCHHRDRHRATALEHLCDPKWERRRGAASGRDHEPIGGRGPRGTSSSLSALTRRVNRRDRNA